LQNRLVCHFNTRHLLRFLAMAFPVFIVGGIGIARLNAWLLIPWIGFALSYFGLIEIRVMCSHCPHYAEPGSKTLQCWANYGSPKLWKYRPGPMSQGEKIIFFAGLGVLAGYPLVFLVVGRLWMLMALFAIFITGMAAMMDRLMCSHCMNFACPFNQVDQVTRDLFWRRNPSVARAWRQGEN
jgi:hypothetical protein